MVSNIGRGRILKYMFKIKCQRKNQQKNLLKNLKELRKVKKIKRIEKS